MAKISLDKLTYADLVELQNDVAEALTVRRAEEQKALRERLSALAEESGFSVSELFGKAGKRKSVAVAREAKYRNPKDPSQTWSGRGRKPNWLVEAEGKGTNIEKFAV